jgi:hypothetical protein
MVLDVVLLLPEPETESTPKGSLVGWLCDPISGFCAESGGGKVEAVERAGMEKILEDTGAGAGAGADRLGADWKSSKSSSSAGADDGSVAKPKLAGFAVVVDGAGSSLKSNKSTSGSVGFGGAAGFLPSFFIVEEDSRFFEPAPLSSNSSYSSKWSRLAWVSEKAAEASSPPKPPPSP